MAPDLAMLKEFALINFPFVIRLLFDRKAESVETDEELGVSKA